MIVKDPLYPKVDITKLEDIELGWNGRGYGYRDPVDAYLMSATINGRELTEDELRWIEDNHPGFAPEHAFKKQFNLI